MKWLFVGLLLAVIRASKSFTCPHDDPTLFSWTDGAAWLNGQVPQNDGDDGTLTGNLRLDSQPPTLHHLTIAAGAKLVFDPSVYVHLKVHAIYVEGELHIGSKDCLFEADTHVTFLGNVNEDKVLLVKAGGTLEIHGARKLPWTKLAETAEKLDNTNAKLDIRDLPLCNDMCSSGLVLYHINPDTGELVMARLFDLTVSAAEIEDKITDLIDTTADIPNGHVVGIALKKAILASKVDHDLTPVYDFIELLTGGGPSQTRNVDLGSAYAMLAIKNNPSTAVETFEPNVGTNHEVSATLYFGSFAIVLNSFVTNKGSRCDSHVELHIYLDELYRPTITLLDDVGTWKVGDKLVMASTDYDYNQAEEVTILEVNLPNKVRLSGPLKYTHYGKIYKGVDMKGEVGLLTRNVKFDSEDAAESFYYGGHIKVLKDFARVHIEGAELENLGQQEVLGAYSIHFHMCEDVDGDEETRPWIRENSIHDANSRCITVHGTHGLILEDNVCSKTIGHSYFLEDGGEQRTIINGNLGLGTETPKGLGLIKTDNSCPTTFWITNPKTNLTNNVAAGGSCRGYWFTYPDKPTGPSKDKNFMVEFEARYTAIYEFENNVAHSYKDAGLFIDNILRQDGVSAGYNRYRPMKNPLENNCMINEKNCEDECVYLRRFTGYKNSKQNTWIRGGCMKLVQSSMSDSTISVILLRDNPAYQFLENSIILGDSDNTGEPETFLPADGSLQRSFPFGSSAKLLDRNGLRTGVEIFRGPQYIRDVWFADFSNKEGYYGMGALGFRRSHKGRSSPRAAVEGLTFGFDDPSQGNRVLDYGEGDDLFTSFDGDDVANFRDVGASVTETDVCESPMVVRPEPFHLTGQCFIRQNWNMAWCCETFGEILVKDFSAIRSTQFVTMTRDDVDAQISSDTAQHAPFIVILGGKYSYSMSFDPEIPTHIQINTEAITNSDYVRIGICLPPNAQFGLFTNFPTRFQNKDQWTNVDSLSALDSDTTGGKYFYSSTTGYFATVLRHARDFEPEEYHPNPMNIPITLKISIQKGDRTNTKCLPAARQELGSLAPTQSTKRNLLSEPRQLVLTARSTSGTVGQDNRTLYGDTSSPPEGLGAGSTHVPRFMK